MSRTSRVVIYRLGSLGDTITALPCFHLIERAYPDSERVVLTNTPVSTKAAPLESILGPGGFIDGSIPYPIGTRSPRELLRLVGLLRRQKTATLVYLTASRGLGVARRDVAFFTACGFRNIVGAPLSSDLQRSRVMPGGDLEPESHRLVRNLRELGAIDLTDRSSWDLRLTATERRVAADALGETANRRFIAVNTGGKVVQKDWGVGAWAALLRGLRDRLDHCDLVFIGGRDDTERALQLSDTWPGRVVLLCGVLSPRESAAALARATLFIGHDSGPLHLADSVGTAAIGLFGDYNRPKQWHPSGTTTRIIHRLSGLADITPDEVLVQAVELSAAAPSGSNQGG